MKQQFTTPTALLSPKEVKAVLNASQWDFEYEGQRVTTDAVKRIRTRLEKGLFTEVMVKEYVEQAKCSKDFEEYYNEVHLYKEGDVIDIADLVDNINYHFAAFIAPDIAATVIGEDDKYVLNSYTFFIK